MKKMFALILVALGIWCLSTLALAQPENLSTGRTLGLGMRFLPSALYPNGPMETDQALGTVVTAQLWFSDSVGLEAGGWVSGFSDQWSERSFTNMVAGMIFKIVDGDRADLYAAGRGIRMEGINRNPGYCCVRCVNYACPVDTQPKENKDGDQPTISKPWPGGYENRTSTLAFEGVAGLEWSLSRNMVLDFEFGMIFAQVMGVNFPPNPEEKPTTYSSTSFGMTLHLGVYYYFVPTGTK
jgi:hypothetical protein